MRFEGYTKTTFGKLKIGDTFNSCCDFDADSLNKPEFYKRIKTGEAECKYADGTPMAFPEISEDLSEVVYIKPAL